ncbi:unnamed protein product, partial [Ixodes hexagonus]
VPEDFLKLRVPSTYWSCHRFPTHSGLVYCKLRMCANEVSSERVVLLWRDNMPGVAYSAHLCGRRVEEGRLVTCEEAEKLLRNVDSYGLCRGALPTSSMPKSYLTKCLEEQVAIREETYFSSRCAGKEPAQGQACVSCRYLRKALLTRQSRLKRSVKMNVRSTTQRLRSALQKNRRMSARYAVLKEQFKQMQDENASKPDELLQLQIAALPPKQQECVRQC